MFHSSDTTGHIPDTANDHTSDTYGHKLDKTGKAPRGDSTQQEDRECDEILVKVIEEAKKLNGEDISSSVALKENAVMKEFVDCMVKHVVVSDQEGSRGKFPHFMHYLTKGKRGETQQQEEVDQENADSDEGRTQHNPIFHRGISAR